MKYADLDADELAFIMGMKADSKTVKDAVEQAKSVPPLPPEQFDEGTVRPRRSFFETVERKEQPVSKESEPANTEPEQPEPVREEPLVKEPEPVSKEPEEPKIHLQKGQKSLFDF